MITGDQLSYACGIQTVVDNVSLATAPGLHQPVGRQAPARAHRPSACQQGHHLLLGEPTNHLGIRYQHEILALMRSLG